MLVPGYGYIGTIWAGPLNGKRFYVLYLPRFPTSPDCSDTTRERGYLLWAGHRQCWVTGCSQPTVPPAFLVRWCFFVNILVALPIFTEFLIFPCAVFCPCAPEVEASMMSRNAGLPPGDRVNGWVRARLQPLEIVS